MDPLSDVLATLRLRATLYFRARLAAPWGLDVPANRSVARFHLALRGRCHLSLGVRRPQVVLEPGDLALVPHGARHELRSEVGVATVPVGAVLDEARFDGSGDLEYGRGDEPTILVCGHFAFDDPLLHPVVESIPALIHLKGSEGHDFTWLDAATRAISFETRRRAPGWSSIVDRVSEILFVQILRSLYVEGNASPAMSAFVDPRLSRALLAIHRQPEEGWTLERLAREAAMSRTAFAVRFRALVGITPMAYLARWRMQRARRALLESDQKVALIASRFGFGSEAAFSRAFRRSYGAPPSQLRKSAARA